jgi:hypothetical protein
MGMQTERFGYFRFKNEGRVHYLDEVKGRSTLRSLCGRDRVGEELIPADFEETERDLCKTCKRVEDTTFWGWEQMI